MLNRLCIYGLACLISSDLIGEVSLSDFGTQYGLKYTTTNGKVELKNAQHQFVFTPGSKEALLDQTKVFLTYPLQEKPTTSSSVLWKRIGRRLQQILHPQKPYEISPIDVQNYLLPVLFPQKVPQSPHKVVVIDPGHGGKAHGAVNQRLNLKEKDLSLQMALRLKRKLQQSGYTVHLTRETDKDVALEDRTAFANRKLAGVFISLHFNSAASVQASGIEIFTYTFAHCPSTDRLHPNMTDHYVAPINHWDSSSTLLAYVCQKQLIRSLKMVDRGIRRGRMKVLEKLRCPGILIEGGFISNPQEARKIASAAYQDAFADAIIKGLDCYFQSGKNNKKSLLLAPPPVLKKPTPSFTLIPPKPKNTYTPKANTKRILLPRPRK